MFKRMLRAVRLLSSDTGVTGSLFKPTDNAGTNDIRYTFISTFANEHHESASGLISIVVNLCAPTIAIDYSNAPEKLVLSWTGQFVLQTSTNLSVTNWIVVTNAV